MAYRNPQRRSRSGRSSRQSFKCPTNHKPPVVKKCSTNAVYEFPMTCGAMYVGETSRCATERLREHKRSMSKDSTLARHSETCKETDCSPMLEKARIVRVHKNVYERRKAEARLICDHVRDGTPCVNVLKNPEAIRRRYNAIADQVLADLFQLIALLTQGACE
ncbi:uncharacterized protein LOC144138627 isoform X1 [Haemaphysalis longicornis]